MSDIGQVLGTAGVSFIRFSRDPQSDRPVTGSGMDRVIERRTLPTRYKIAAGIAALDVLVNENMIERVAGIAPYFENAVHSLKGSKHVIDIRNYGLAAGLTLAPVPGEPAKRPFQVAMRCLEKGFYVRYGGDTIQLAPPFIVEKSQIDSLINALGEALSETD